MTTPPRIQAPVTVSIVSHGQIALLMPLLEQLDRWCHSHIAKVVLTINRPEDIPAFSTLRFPVEQIRNRQPQGYGANHNAAFAHCRSAWFLVLNPDIRLDADLLGRLLGKAAPKAGLIAPRIHEPGKTGPEPYRGLVSPLELLRRRRPGHRPPAAPVWVAGMFMLLRSEAMAQVKGFDERFFMYCEDFDLCARLRLAGWALQVDPASTVEHMAQRASQSSLRPLLWHLRSFMKMWTASAFWRYRSLLQREEAKATGA